MKRHNLFRLVALSVLFAWTTCAQIVPLPGGGVMWRQKPAAGGGGGAGASATDNFNAKAVASPMSASMTDGASTWVNAALGAFNRIQTLNLTPVVAAGTTGDSAAMVATPTFAANQWSSVTLANTTEYAGALVRLDSNGNGYIVYIAGSATTLRCSKVSGNGSTFTPIGADIIVSALIAGDVLRLEASGTSTTTLTVKVNGLTVATRTDSSSPYTSGQPGIFSNQNGRLTSFSASDL